MRCSVPSCYSKTIKSIKISLFGVPKTDVLKLEWEKALGIRLRTSSKVCRAHFKDEDIIDTWVSGKGLSKYTIRLKRPSLRKGAIPIDLKSFHTVSSETLTSNLVQANVPNENEILVSNIINDHCYYSVKGIKTEIASPINDESMLSSPEIIEVPQNLSFKDILNQINIDNIPNKWFYDNMTNKKKIISFHKLGPYREDFTRCIEKQLHLTEDLQLLLYAYNKKIHISDIGYISEVNTVNSYENLLNIIKRFDEIPVCQGAISSNQISDVNSSYGYQFVESYGMWRHIKCCTILTRDNSVHSICVWCKRLCYIIKNRIARHKNNLNTRVFFSPRQQKNLQQIKNQKYVLRKKYSRATKKIIFLQNQLNEIKTKMKNISQSRIDELLDLDSFNITINQSELTYESDN